VRRLIRCIVFVREIARFVDAFCEMELRTIQNKLANCETVKLWTQAIDSKGSTVSQFHSLTKRHGGWGPKTMRGWVPEAWGVGQKQGPRDQGNKGTRKRKSKGVGGASGVCGARKRADSRIPAASDLGTEGTEKRKAVFRFQFPAFSSSC
jgi:hypothetical protein